MTKNISVTSSSLYKSQEWITGNPWKIPDWKQLDNKLVTEKDDKSSWNIPFTLNWKNTIKSVKTKKNKAHFQQSMKFKTPLNVHFGIETSIFARNCKCTMVTQISLP